MINSCSHANCEPTTRTISFIKKNLVYCFDTSVRGHLKESIDTFEHKFFSNAAREQRRLLKERNDRQSKSGRDEQAAEEIEVEEAVIQSEPTTEAEAAAATNQQ